MSVFTGLNWRTLVPMFLMMGRMIAQKLRTQDADTIGGDDEAAELIEHLCVRLENYLKANP